MVRRIGTGVAENIESRTGTMRRDKEKERERDRIERGCERDRDRDIERSSRSRSRPEREREKSRDREFREREKEREPRERDRESSVGFCPKMSDFDSDIKEECSKFGKLKHIYVDRDSAGIFYLRFQDMQGAINAQRNLHGRWFAG
ncbi:zinc finger CCCH domain-containing protein 13-like [Hibiscus syriacus]|uniref:zinc finger CCCH domain-containing protein 13-like n=1 Tax=Hibiscus syriacus TaxID=106335 RepID=UPI001921078B|nr:zinc finger CCCH domain-containing protein 13-like [Hibiscus syriacus]